MRETYEASELDHGTMKECGFSDADTECAVCMWEESTEVQDFGKNASHLSHFDDMENVLVAKL